MNELVLSVNKRSIKEVDNICPDLTPDDKDKLRNEIKNIVKQAGVLLENLMPRLVKVEKNKLWKEWGFTTFKEYLQIEVSGLTGAKSRQTFQRYFDNLEIFKKLEMKPEDLKGLTARKFHEIKDMITLENKDEMLKHAKEKSVKTLIRMRKEQQFATGGQEQPVYKNFKLWPEQLFWVNNAFQTVRELAGKPNVCENQMLQYICMEFVTSNSYTESRYESLQAYFSRLQNFLQVNLLVVCRENNALIMYSPYFDNLVSEFKIPVKEKFVPSSEAGD